MVARKLRYLWWLKPYNNTGNSLNNWFLNHNLHLLFTVHVNKCGSNQYLLLKTHFFREVRIQNPPASPKWLSWKKVLFRKNRELAPHFGVKIKAKKVTTPSKKHIFRGFCPTLKCSLPCFQWSPKMFYIINYTLIGSID